MSKLTKEEIKWVEKAQEILNECPSKRIGFFTIGDSDLTLYDNTKMDEIMSYFDAGKSEYGGAVEKLARYLAGLLFSQTALTVHLADADNRGMNMSRPINLITDITDEYIAAF